MNYKFLILIILIIVVLIVIISIFIYKKKSKNNQTEKFLKPKSNLKPIFEDQEEKKNLVNQIEQSNRDFTSSIKQNYENFQVNIQPSTDINTSESVLEIPKFNDIGVFSNQQQNVANKSQANQFQSIIGISRSSNLGGLNHNDIQNASLDELNNSKDQQAILRNNKTSNIQAIKPNLSLALRNDKSLLQQYAQMESGNNSMNQKITDQIIGKIDENKGEKSPVNNQKLQLNNKRKNK